MQVAVVTMFPRMFEAIEHWGIAGRAIESGLLSLQCFDPRVYTADRHRRVDDRPYGGGPGMVMMVAPLRAAIAAAEAQTGGRAHRVYLSPQGVKLDQRKLRDLATMDRLILLCGRYEGVDERLLVDQVDEEISIGDYVLSGGEVAAMVVLEGVIRLIPGALGHADSAGQDSFENGLLDCPHFTRPELIDGLGVPPVLLSGDHEAIRLWRLKQALGRTWARRPDLLSQATLTEEQQHLLREYRSDPRNADRHKEIDGTGLEDEP